MVIQKWVFLVNACNQVIGFLAVLRQRYNTVILNILKMYLNLDLLFVDLVAFFNTTLSENLSTCLTC